MSVVAGREDHRVARPDVPLSAAVPAAVNEDRPAPYAFRPQILVASEADVVSAGDRVRLGGQLHHAHDFLLLT